MKKFTKIIVFLFILIAMFQQSLSQESGWAGDGLIKFQKFPTDSIVKYGLSPDGDTLKTFHRGGKLFYWDIKSGNLIKEKQLPEGIKVSEDMMTYFKYRDSIYSGSSLNSRVYASDVSVFDIYNDVNIFSTGFIKLAEAQYTEFYRQFTDFSFNHKKFFIVLSSRYYTVVVDQTNVLSYSINFNKDSIYIDSKTFPLAAQCIYNNRFDKILYLYSTSYWGRHSEGGSSNVLGFFDLNKNENININSSYSSGITYKNPRFLNNNNKVSAFNSRKLHIWELKPLKLIDEHNPIKGYSSFADYLFIKDDNFLAYSNEKIFIYDFNSKLVIDSSDVINSNKNTFLQYSNINDKLFFFNNDKFGIYESAKLNKIGNLNISVDSNHVYTGKPYNVFLFGISDSAKVKWESSDGQTSNEINPTFRFDSLGYISFTVTVNVNGTEYQKTFENIVNVLPMLVADFDSDIRFGSAPLTVKFRNFSKGSNLTFEWSFGNGKTSNEKDPVITYDSAGRYHVSLKVRDSLNIASLTIHYFIQIDKPIFSNLIIQNLHNSRAGSFTHTYNGYPETINYKLFPIGTIKIIDTIYTIYTEFGIKDQTPRPFSYVVNLDKDLKFNYKSQGVLGSNILYPKILEFKDQYVFPIINGGIYYKIPALGLHNYGFPDIRKYLGFDSKEVPNQKINLTKYSDNSFIMSYNLKDSLSEIKLISLNLEEINIDSLEYYSIDVVNYQKDVLNIIYDIKLKSNYILYTDSAFNFIKKIKINNPQTLSFKTFALLSNNNLAFGGNTEDNKGILGVMDLNGNILWSKILEDWITFQRIIVKQSSFRLLGTNIQSSPGFVEVNFNGEKLNDYRIFDDGVNYTHDVDDYDSNHVLITYIFNNLYHRVAKVKYTPLLIENTPNDTTKTDTTANKIKSINPNPALSEITIEFFNELVPIEIKIYSSEGLLVDSKFLKKENTTEITHNIQKLSIGIYFVKVITETEILEGKFIKY
ncbi:hypothetical protein MASR1M45_05100 [Candidatus Kapaibacterium sp.]